LLAQEQVLLALQVQPSLLALMLLALQVQPSLLVLRRMLSLRKV
jgi:hypothetical protein